MNAARRVQPWSATRPSARPLAPAQRGDRQGPGAPGEGWESASDGASPVLEPGFGLNRWLLLSNVSCQSSALCNVHKNKRRKQCRLQGRRNCGVKKSNTDTSLRQQERLQHRFKTKGRTLIGVSAKCTQQPQPLPEQTQKVLWKGHCSSVKSSDPFPSCLVTEKAGKALSHLLRVGTAAHSPCILAAAVRDASCAFCS